MVWSLAHKAHIKTELWNRNSSIKPTSEDDYD